MAATRGFYRRWYGLESERLELTPGDPAEIVSKSATVRITDNYFSTDSGKIYWWTGTVWLKWGDSLLPPP